MIMTVPERVRAVATFRYIEVRLMEIVAGWTPTTPEMEAKVMFGRHIWDFAQHADALGKRTYELRQPEHYTVPADPSYVKLLTRVASETSTSGRLSSLYEGILPGLARRYRDYIAATDAILDEPTVVIMERIVADLDRQTAQARQLIRELRLPGEPPRDLSIEEQNVSHLHSGEVHV